jgi:uncharacterized protein YqeY
MTMSLKQRISEDVKAAMRARDRDRLSVLRMVSAAIKQREVDERIELDDSQVLAVLDKMCKQRRESLEQFEAAGRHDLARKEGFELGVVQSYMPEPLEPQQLDELIGKTIEELGAKSMRDMGPVMNALRDQVQGRADMKAVSQAVRNQLSD